MQEDEYHRYHVVSAMLLNIDKKWAVFHFNSCNKELTQEVNSEEEEEAMTIIQNARRWYWMECQWWTRSDWVSNERLLHL